MTLSWRNLTSEEQQEDPILCGICKTRQRVVKVSNTELACNYATKKCSRCNVAYRLECGHIVVDDCDSAKFDGRTLQNEVQWQKQILTKPFSDYSVRI
jgi:hypothetical protein